MAYKRRGSKPEFDWEWLVDTQVAEQDRLKGSPEAHAAPLVSVIVPHFNDLDNLRLLVSLLAGQTLPADRFEIVVADNNSTCGIAKVQEICTARARVMPAPIPGAAEARNAGVAASHGQILAFIDSDCRPKRDWLQHGVAALARAEMVGGEVNITAEDEQNLTAVEAFEKIFAFDFKRYIEREGFSGAGNMFVPRKIFDMVGGFRSGVSEDKDWGRRAVAKGFRWTYAPEVQVSHPARRDWEGLRSKWRRITRESYRLEREKPFGRLRWILRAWAVLFSPLVHAARILRSPELPRFNDKIKAIGVLFRIRFWRFLESYRVLWKS
jgi:glycosyltransferase involved in cell wall biosynthesis